jgi:hypothetical protein
MKIFGKEPAFWIGLIVTLIVGVVQTLSGNGLISDIVAGKVIDLVNAFSQVALLMAPVIAALIIRGGVTPTSQPSLEQGTKLTVITPGDNPNFQTTVG